MEVKSYCPNCGKDVDLKLYLETYTTESFYPVSGTLEATRTQIIALVCTICGHRLGPNYLGKDKFNELVDTALEMKRGERMVKAECALKCGRTKQARDIAQLHKAGWLIVQDDIGLFGEPGNQVYICPNCHRKVSEAMFKQP